MSNAFYIADLHFGHTNIIWFDGRPFSTVEEMNDTLVANWNNRVKDSDTVYILGDFSFRLPHKQRDEILASLNGQKVLIRGNHDEDIRPSNNRGELRMLKKVTDYLEMRDGDHKVILSHYPMMAWNGSFHGSIHLFGHVHWTTPEALQVREWQRKMAETGRAPKMYNVGCMVPYMRYTPKTLKEIIKGENHV